MSLKPERLSRDVFIALAAVGWADGELSSVEADAIVRAAADSGLELEEIAEIDEATKQPVAIGRLDNVALTDDERRFVYGVAAWIARIDGQVGLDELAALHTLGVRLGVNKTTQHQINALVDTVAQHSDAARPEQYDLMGLRRLIHERLS